MQTKLRKMDINIESAQIENENLKNVQNQEVDLRQTRDSNEKLLLEVASNAQDESMA